MKESEAKKNMRWAIKAYDAVEVLPECVVSAARDLLDAEPDDDDALPWKVRHHFDLVAKFDTEERAEFYVGNEYHPDQFTITGPDDHHAAPNPGTVAPNLSTPRLVEITNWPQPTLDQIDGPGMVYLAKEQMTCVMVDNGGEAWFADDRGDCTRGSLYTSSSCTVLDADPIRPKTVGELDPEMIVCDEDGGWLFNLGYANNFWQMGRSRVWKLPADTPITGPIYRMETNDE